MLSERPAETDDRIHCCTRQLSKERARILLVEDEVLIQMIAVDYLEEFGLGSRQPVLRPRP